MAEQPRLTNKQRRALAREERRRAEAAAAQKKQRVRTRNGLVTFAIVGVIAAVLLQAFMGGTASLDDAIQVSRSEVAAARDAAGCTTLAERQPLPDAFHFEANQAPNPSLIYPDIRPTHSGPHTATTHPVLSSSRRQVSEVSSTHNLEHGTIIVWYDPDQVDRSTVSDISDWAELLNENGFRRDLGGVGIMSSPYTDPGISSSKAVALRAWGTAVDCDTWDESVGMGFVLEHFGTNGIAPERPMAPFPTDVLQWADNGAVNDTGDEADDATDDATDGQGPSSAN